MPMRLINVTNESDPMKKILSSNSISGSLVKKPTVRIINDGFWCFVEPACADLLVPLFRRERTRFALGGDQGVIHQTKSLELYRLQNNKLILLSGFIPRIARELEQNGFAVGVKDLVKPRSKVQLDEAALDKLTGHEMAFVKSIGKERSGLIHAPRLVDRLNLVTAAAYAFPEAVIVLVAPTRKLARALAQRWQDQTGQPVEVRNSGGCVISDSRLIVATQSGLDPCRSDLIFFLEATDLLSQCYWPLLKEIKTRHLYGFSASKHGREELELLYLTGFYGEVVHDADKLRAPSTPVSVHLTEMPWLNMPVNSSGLERKRQAVWNNNRRNEVVAAVAKAVVDDSQDDLIAYGLDLGGKGGRSRHRRPRVAILVESPEHGRALQRLLPTWPLLKDRKNREVGFSSISRRDSHDLDEGLPGLAIVTMMHAQDIDQFDVDVLIRADGNGWPLKLPGFPPRLEACEDRGATLIDFGDESDAASAEATRARLEGYRSKGWTVYAPDPWHPRLESIPAGHK